MFKLSTMGLFLILVGAPLARAPDCAYTRYGCTYLIYNRGNGLGDVLMSCDGGARYYSYSGSVGTCPNQD